MIDLRPIIISVKSYVMLNVSCLFEQFYYPAFHSVVNLAISFRNSSCVGNFIKFVSVIRISQNAVRRFHAYGVHKVCIWQMRQRVLSVSNNELHYLHLQV